MGRCPRSFPCYLGNAGIRGAVRTGENLVMVVGEDLGEPFGNVSVAVFTVWHCHSLGFWTVGAA